MSALIFAAKTLLFLVLFFLTTYFPGRVLLGKKVDKQSPLSIFYISVIFGVALIILQALVLGLTNLRILSFPLIGILTIVGLLKHYKIFIKGISEFWSNKPLVVLVCLGIIIQGFINFPSGWQYQNGIQFWSSQGHDGLWHVSFMEEIKNNFPPNNPLFAGHGLTNYHFTSDIFMGEFFRIAPLFSALDLYFRFYPIVLSILIGIGVFLFASSHWNEKAALWSVFFAYFCGSFGYIVALINHQFIFSGETTFWASQGNTILGNPPHTFGIIFLTSILLLLDIWVKTKKNIWLILIFILGFGLSTVKVSSGVILAGGILATGFFALIFRKEYRILLLGILLSISNFLLLKVISPTAQSFLVLEPLWFPRTMMVVRLNWMDWELRRQHYMWVNNWRSWLREFSLEFQAIVIFIVGNTGMRLLGFGEIFSKLRKKLDFVDVFMITGSAAAVLIVLFFVQSGITFNLIQFVQIYLHFIGIYAGITTWKFIRFAKPTWLKVSIAVLIITLAVPTAIGNLFDFYGSGKKPLAYISNGELEGLNWLKNNTPINAVIFTKPFDKDAHYKYKSQPLPISAWYSTMYVHSISGRRTFLSGEEQLMITGYKFEDELIGGKSFMAQQNPKEDNLFLSKYGIDYIYLRLDEIKNPINKTVNITEVFKNNEVVIYKHE